MSIVYIECKIFTMFMNSGHLSRKVRAANITIGKGQKTFLELTISIGARMKQIDLSNCWLYHKK